MSDLAIELDDLRYAWPGQAALLRLRTLQVRRGESLFVAGGAVASLLPALRACRLSLADGLIPRS